MHVVVRIIRILALSQRKTLTETKSRTLKCLKWHYSTVRSMKTVAVLTEDGVFDLFFRPHTGGFDSSRFPTPRNLPPKAKKMPMPLEAGRRWNWLMHKWKKAVLQVFITCFSKLKWESNVTPIFLALLKTLMFSPATQTPSIAGRALCN